MSDDAKVQTEGGAEKMAAKTSDVLGVPAVGEPIQPAYRTRFGEQICVSCNRPASRCRCQNWEWEDSDA
jgi:hypothetical protein